MDKTKQKKIIRLDNFIDLNYKKIILNPDWFQAKSIYINNILRYFEIVKDF